MKTEKTQRWRVPVGTVRISPRAKRYVREALDNDRLAYGPFLRKFEERFAAEHDCKFAVSCNSGTSALHVAVAALQERGRWKPGDEVLVPALTFVATANMALVQGLKPVFVDVDPRTYNIDPERAEAALTRRTRLMMPVHLFGQPCEMGPLMGLARRKRLKVVEDSCETMFSRWRGRSVGSFGDAACFSTYTAHLLVTGVGGLVTTNSAPLATHLRSLVNHGRDSIYLSIDQGRSAQVMARRFRFVRLGYSYRLTELEGALGVAQLEERAALMVKRKRNALALMKALRPYEEWLQLPWWPDYSEHAFMMFPLVLRSETKTAITDFLERRGIETRDMLPLTNQPYLHKLFGSGLERRFPNAAKVNRSGFYIGCHHGLSEGDVDYVAGVFKAFFAGRKRK
ncbi:MAG: DegT/DnrJ/EryC1/StrS family aminotransferase [Elusimicrobia bacterium]|nr:DegT/DnrJ/EryC1/StrS family aminotransferase [Elusimicrobiota bacterium]